MSNHYSPNAFIFGIFISTFAWLSFIVIIDPNFLYRSNIGSNVIFMLIGSAFLIWALGNWFFSDNWIQATQLILICALTIFLSSISIPLVGLGVGALAFGVLTFGYKVSVNTSSQKSSSFIWMAFKWLIISILGTIVSIGVEKFIN